MKIYCAKHSGFCFGVKRAIKMAIDAAKHEQVVYSFGPLIHNRIVVENLAKKGIITINGLNEIKDKNKSVIIRSHGIHPDLLQDLKDNYLKIIDATCPKVRRAQRYAERLAKAGYFVVIVGEKDHPEVKGLLGYAGRSSAIYSDQLEIANKKVGVVPQTTINIEQLDQAVARMLPWVVEMKIYNTICNETILRIEEALAIAKKVDAMIVIGGKNSANTTRLYQLCKDYRPAYHIESKEEICAEWFGNVQSLGITAGASTSKEQVKEIVKYLSQKYSA